MKQFISFVRKEFYHIFRDARTTMILLLMPVILIILFGYAILYDPFDHCGFRYLQADHGG